MSRLPQQRTRRGLSDANAGSGELVVFEDPDSKSQLERKEIAVHLTPSPHLFSRPIHFLTPQVMHPFSCILIIPRITPSGVLDIPEEVWPPLIESVRDRFGVSLKLYDHSPAAERGADFVASGDLFLEFVGPSAEAVNLALRAIHGRIDYFVEQYTKHKASEIAAGQ